MSDDTHLKFPAEHWITKELDLLHMFRGNHSAFMKWYLFAKRKFTGKKICSLEEAVKIMMLLIWMNSYKVRLKIVQFL